MWKAKYNSAKEVRDVWVEETYDMSDMVSMSFRGCKDLVPLEAGGILPIHEIDFGPSGHQSTVWLLPLDNLKPGFAVKVSKIRLCHTNCPNAQLEYFLTHAAQGIARGWGGVQADLASIKYGPAAEMRAHFRLQPDSLANTVEKDVLWVA
jgi:hypothetical protein